MKFGLIPGWKCTSGSAPATHALELYAAKDGRAHGDLVGRLAVCEAHKNASRVADMHLHHVSPYVLLGPFPTARPCGDFTDYRDVTPEESVQWMRKIWPGAFDESSPITSTTSTTPETSKPTTSPKASLSTSDSDTANHATVTVECGGHVLLAGTLQRYALLGRIAAPEGHELLTFVYRDAFDPDEPDAARPVRRARLVVEELGIVAQVETQGVEGPAQDVVSRGRFVGCDDCGSVTTCAPAERCWRGNPEANLPVDQADDEDDQDVGGPEVQLLVDSKVHAVGTLDEVKAAVAELVTTLLVANPVSLAEDAGNLNRVFNDGTVFDAVTEHGRWWTLFGVATPQPVRIEVNRR